jgi:phage replication O-like protein O
MNAEKVIQFPTKVPQEPSDKGVQVADLSNGYTKTANEIQQLKPKLKMSGREWQCFEAIIWLTYGWNKKQDRVTNTVLAELTGLDDANIVRTLNSLSERKIIVCQKQGSMKLVSVNTAISQWILDKKTAKNALSKSTTILPESTKVLSESTKNLSEMTNTQYKNKNSIKNTTSENSCESSDESLVSLPDPVPEKPKTKHPDAAIQSPKGDKWATAEDLQAAEYLHSKIQIIRPTAKTPNWVDWANTIRIMRESDGRTHREICELFKFANQDAFWSSNILSPVKLREKWDTLCIKRDTQPAPKHRTSAEAWDAAAKDTSWAKDLGGW